jgi:hypothetical protein
VGVVVDAGAASGPSSGVLESEVAVGVLASAGFVAPRVCVDDAGEAELSSRQVVSSAGSHGTTRREPLHEVARTDAARHAETMRNVCAKDMLEFVANERVRENWRIRS